MTNIDQPSPDSVKPENSETPILMQKSDYKSIFENIIIKSLNEKHSNVSCCFHCGQNRLTKKNTDLRNIIEISCCGLLQSNFAYIPDNYNEEVFPEDFIVLKNEDSIEVAQVKLVGELVKIKRHYFGLVGEILPTILRKASLEDIERLRKNISDEKRAVGIFKFSVSKFNLEMKLVNIHYQFDRKKLFFFYTADGRVDFRELAKDLANEFKTRIELRQIGVRDEAKKVGGVGSCGREYCCLSFLNNFKRITTQLANDQNLLTSMGKLSGPCGKLKCCLSFEVE